MSFMLNDIRAQLLRIVAPDAADHPSDVDVALLADAGLVGFQQGTPALTVNGCWFLAVLLEPDRVRELNRLVAELGTPSLSAVVEYALDTDPCPNQMAAQ